MSDRVNSKLLNILLKVKSVVLPSSLWTNRFLVALVGSYISILIFDVLWCSLTNYLPLKSISTYLYTLTLAFVMALPSLLFRRKWPQLITLLLLDLLFMANLMYCRTYYEMIPPASYLLVGNVMQFTDSIFASIKWSDFLLPLVAVATVFLMPAKSKRFPLWRYLATLCVLIALCVVYMIPRGGVSQHIAELKGSAYWHAAPPVIFTLPVALADGIVNGLAPLPQQDIDEAETVIKERMTLMRQYEISDVPDSLRRDNLVMIIVESLEAWPIGQKIGEQEITPNINRWIADTTTWYANRVASQTGIGRSIDGQLLMTTGLCPTTNRVFSMVNYESAYPSLAHELYGANGANSYLLTGDQKSTWNLGAMVPAFGFQTTKFREEWDCTEYFGSYKNPTDKSLFTQIVQRMQDGQIWPIGEKAMVEVITFSSHHPWIINPDERSLVIDRQNSKIHSVLAAYIEAINYVDNALAIFIEYLKCRPDWERTMVVIVGDHEALANQRREMQDESPDIQDIVEENEYVPMIVLNSPISGRRNEVMGQVDVYSTILNLMGIEPQWPGLGFSAFSPLSPKNASKPISQPNDYSQGEDSLEMRVQNLIKMQSKTGNTIISADLLRDKLNYNSNK